jgi:hypothetical protein
VVVRVDQARHHQVAAGVDHLVGRRWQLGRRADGFDQVVAH